MSPDDVDDVTFDLYNLLVKQLGCDLGEDADYETLKYFMLDAFQPFYTRDRNYN